MKYLFFDIECASVYKGSKMCSFGYVLADENLNVIESDDIIINPKSDWDFYALKNILAHSKEYYESFPSFDQQYDRIKNLLEGEIIAFGHGVSNDVRFLNDDCARYNLPFIDFVFYDGAQIYRDYGNDKEIKSLAKVSAILSSHKQAEKHESKEDAELVYEYIKNICKNMDMTISELLSLVPKYKGVNKKGAYSVYGEKKNKSKKNKGKLFEYIVKYVEPNCNEANKFLMGKKVSISEFYEKNNFKRIVYIIQLIANKGGKYVLDEKEADIFLKYDVADDNGRIECCPKEYEIDKLIENGKNIKKIDVEDFLKMIDYNENEVMDVFNEIKEKTVNIIKNEKKQKVKQL